MLLIAVSGCQTYRPLALDQSAASPTTLPADAELDRLAANLHNPLVRSTPIDSRNGYTPEALAIAAVVLNPSLHAVRDRVAVANAQATQAGLLPNPVLAFNLDVPVGSNTAGEVAGYGLSVEWEITSLLMHAPRLEAARHTREQGRLDIAWQEWQIAQAARQAAYDVLALRRQRAAATALADRLDHIAADTTAALQKHDITANAAAAVTAAAGEAHIAVAASERELADAELALRRAIGVDADLAVPIDERIVLPTNLSVPAVSRLQDGLADHRIDLVALRRGYAAQESTVRGAILGQFPKISLGLSQTRDTGDFLTLGPTFSIELPVFDHNQGVIAIERATRQQLFDEYRTRTFEARSDIARAVAAIIAIDAQIAVVARQVDTLQTLVSANERALKGGNVDVTTYYTAAVSLAQRQADLTRLQQDLVHGLITLELGAGVYLPMESR